LANEEVVSVEEMFSMLKDLESIYNSEAEEQ